MRRNAQPLFAGANSGKSVLRVRSMVCISFQAAIIPLIGERTRPACSRRRPGDDFRSLTCDQTKWCGVVLRRKCSAGRRTQHAGGLRSPDVVKSSLQPQGWLGDCVNGPDPKFGNDQIFAMGNSDESSREVGWLKND
jgi:hypothetical protein